MEPAPGDAIAGSGPVVLDLYMADPYWRPIGLSIEAVHGDLRGRAKKYLRGPPENRRATIPRKAWV